jgi:ubiquinone/menaquinone biosynthesis C-methylase UbiE
LNTSSHPAPAPAPERTGARDGGYSGEIRASWAEFLNTLPVNARILDIGLGNHVAALVAAEMATTGTRDWRIDAIDPGGMQADAQSSAGKAVAKRINFHANANLARLPFDNASFDAVCAHHAIEFGDTSAILAEVLRVLKPGGDAQFLLHHADSPLLVGARMSLREADLVFTKTKAFRRVHRLVTMHQIVPNSTEHASNEVRMVIRTLKRGLPVAQQQGGGRVLAIALDGIQKVLAARRELKPDAAGLNVDRAEAELRGSVRRLGELVAQARTDEQMRELEKKAAATGFSQIERVAQLHGGEPIAWQLLVHRA